MLSLARSLVAAASFSGSSRFGSEWVGWGSAVVRGGPFLWLVMSAVLVCRGLVAGLVLRFGQALTAPCSVVCGLGAVGWVVGVDDLVAGVGFGDGVAAVVDVVVT